MMITTTMMMVVVIIEFYLLSIHPLALAEGELLFRDRWSAALLQPGGPPRPLGAAERCPGSLGLSPLDSTCSFVCGPLHLGGAALPSFLRNGAWNVSSLSLHVLVNALILAPT